MGGDDGDDDDGGGDSSRIPTAVKVWMLGIFSLSHATFFAHK